MTSPAVGRLTREDWIDVARKALIKGGVAAIKVDHLARQLGVTRGSFYWHFKDIDDFRAQLLAAWQRAATDQVIRELDARPAGPGGVKLLLQKTMRPGRSLERAVRAWAAEDPQAAAAVSAMDDRRLARVQALLTDAGVPAERAAHRAAFLYWAYLGQSVVTDPRHNTIPPEAVDDIADLFEA